MTRSQSSIVSIMLLFLSMQLLLSSCATLGPSMEKPKITVTDLQILEVKALEAIFMLELRVVNPNDFPLDIRGLNCDLNIDGKHFASGVSDNAQEVPAFGTATVPVTVYASFFDMVGSVIQMIQEAEHQQGAVRPLQYELAGKLRLGGGIGNSIPFQSGGQLDLGGQYPQ
ncbi:MAG: LEA type 2 family protein [Thermodesulfobacteriota bacterium]